jgi:hypothetical protein
MDPLSIVASVLAVAQAGDRLIQLVSKIRQFFNALEHVDALINELADLKFVLDTVHMAASNLPEGYSTGFEKALETCNRIILELESTLASFSPRSSNRTSSVQIQMYRIRWLKKKDRVESLRQRLRDAKSTLTLQILSINP